MDSLKANGEGKEKLYLAFWKKSIFKLWRFGTLKSTELWGSIFLSWKHGKEDIKACLLWSIIILLWSLNDNLLSGYCDITECLRLTSSSGDCLVQLPYSAESATVDWQGLYAVGFWISPEMQTPRPLWATSSGVRLPSCKKSIFLCSGGVSCFLSSVHCLLSVDTTEKILGPSSSFPPSDICTHWKEVLLSIFFSRLNSLCSLNLSYQSSLRSVSGLAPVNPCLSGIGNAELDTVLQTKPPQCIVERKDHLFQAAGNIPPNASQGAVGLVCQEVTMRLHFVVHHHPLCRAVFHSVNTPCCICAWGYSTLAFHFV